MFLTMMGSEMRLRAAPDALVGMNHSRVTGFADRTRAPLFGDDLIGRPVKTRLPVAVRQIYQTHQDATGLPVNTGVSEINTEDLMSEHGGA